MVCPSTSPRSLTSARRAEETDRLRQTDRRRCRPRCSRRRRRFSPPARSRGRGRGARGRGAARHPASQLSRVDKRRAPSSDVRADQHCLMAARKCSFGYMGVGGRGDGGAGSSSGSGAEHACGRAGFQRWRRSTEVCTLAQRLAQTPGVGASGVHLRTPLDMGRLWRVGVGIVAHLAAY